MARPAFHPSFDLRRARVEQDEMEWHPRRRLQPFAIDALQRRTGGDRDAAGAGRVADGGPSRSSHGQRSASVSAWPACIFATFSAE